MKKRIIYIGIALVVALGAAYFLWPEKAAQAELTLETEKVGRGNIVEEITATGTLEALETVEVGTQVSGVINEIYVDYNSKVKKGDLLAILDETPLQATLDQSQVQVDNAKAELKYQKANFDRTKALADKKLIADSDYELAEYNYETARQSLKNAELAYEKNRINLSYARIYSPIDGIVLERAVEQGQTVAASYSTPTLFNIVNDLTQMQVEADVDEADIGRVEEGQRVEFTVDAYPESTFSGTVSQKRLQPTESSNVVTYTVIIDAPNPDQKLMPGMTANVSFFVLEKNNIVVVPAKATYASITPATLKKYTELHPEITIDMPEPPAGPPPGEGTAQGGTKDSNRPAMAAAGAQTGSGGMPPMMGAAGESSEGGAEIKMIWVKENNTLSPKMVKVGVTDEVNYEVLDGLKEGDEVITEVSGENNTGMEGMQQSQSGRSPFMPGPPGGRR